MDQNEEANFYFCLMEFADLVKTHGDLVFKELNSIYPQIAEHFKVYMCNQELEELLLEDIIDDPSTYIT